ncbi:H-type lectin domain-containing protein [Streptomyces tsukubensis]|uniref:H-type lectin domain-containing protein n=1 Tax=Streptomyces tsukubensis TaxID=83656 RepID=UPI00344BB725
MPPAYYYSNISQQTQLAGGISAGATTIQVSATTGFPPGFPYVLAVDYGAAAEELVLVTNAAGAVLTVTRGFGGTSGQDHGLGAVVRHVVNAVDLSDFRTHEAATADVHGVSGALVGATQTQTLTNKTLTAPVINNGTYQNGGSFAGTFTGTPTLSGAVVFSGAPSFTGQPVFTGNPVFQGATTGTVVHSHRVSGDGTPRLQVQADGRLLWGSGSAAADTALYRAAPDILATDDILRVARAAATDDAIQVRLAADTQPRFTVDADGSLRWGSGSAAPDVALTWGPGSYLNTDQNVYVGGDLLNKTHAVHAGETGSVGFTFTSQTFANTAVTFATPFAAPPRVFTTIDNAASITNQWTSRVANITTTGFTLIVSGPSATWTNFQVQWEAKIR